MKALILAAGYATRLYPLTKNYPKPLLEVGRKPIINYLIKKLETIDRISEIIVVTNSRFILLFKRWAKQLKTDKKITLVDDLTFTLEDRRGAIGDMDFAIRKKRIRDDLLVIGGDNLFDAGLDTFLSFARANKPHPSIGIYSIKNKDQAKKYGVIQLNGRNRVIDFQEKPLKPKTRLVGMCLYYFPKEKIKRIGEYSKMRLAKRDAVGFYINWLIKKDPVYGFIFKGRWYDIGDKNFYREAKNKFRNK